MTLGIILLIALYILWKLFVDGWLFKIILAVFGWLGIYWYLSSYVEGATKTAITISSTEISWAAVIPSIVIIFAMFTSKEE
jgi:hypothetical protein